MTEPQYPSRAMVRADVEVARTALLAAQAAELPADVSQTVAEAVALIGDAAPDHTPSPVEVPASPDPMQSLLEAKRYLRRALAGADTLHEISCYGFAVVMLRGVIDRAAR